MPRLENWSVISPNENPYLAPELRSKCLKGKIYGSERFEDGKGVVTSSLQELNLKEGYALTRNTKYELGEINPEYKKWCEENNIEIK